MEGNIELPLEKYVIFKKVLKVAHPIRYNCLWECRSWRMGASRKRQLTTRTIA